MLNGQHPVLFVLPDAPSKATLEVAMRAAAGLAQMMSNADYPVNVATVSTSPIRSYKRSNVVLVGLPENNALITSLAAESAILGENGRFITPDGGAIPDDNGVVQILVSPWNAERHVLLISANTDAGLDTLGNALVERTTLAQPRWKLRIYRASAGCLARSPAASLDNDANDF